MLPPSLRPSLSLEWRRTALFVVPAVLALTALLAAVVYSGERPPAPAARVDLAALSDLPPIPGVLVYISGAVVHPGLYRLNRGQRVYESIAVAGGLTSEADPDRLPDLAARLRDGMQVKVPFWGRSTGSGSARITKVDLNTATADELAAIPGFSPDLAAAAVQYRDNYGGFASAGELVSVLGMGQADYNAAKTYVRV